MKTWKILATAAIGAALATSAVAQQTTLRIFTGGQQRPDVMRKIADEYQKRAKQVVEQYNRLEPLPGVNVNGALTLGENIADLTGLVIAHRAYQISLKGQPAPTLDGLTGDQRFYMGWAQVWAGKMRDDARRQQVMVDPHAPEMFRANAPVRNVPEFYSTFGVKEGDKMYLAPEERVKIW